MRKGDEVDPKGLIFESYRIDGISAEECRSIFVDWALAVPLDADNSALIQVLLERHSVGAEEHPMTKVLTDGLQQPKRPKRRGGRAARVEN